MTLRTPGGTHPSAEAVTGGGATLADRARRWAGEGRLARGALVAMLGLSLVAGPLASEARPVAVSLSDMTAVITGSTAGVNVRAEPSFDARVVIQIADGTPVDLRIAEVDTVLDPDGVTRWWPISVYDTDGWVTGYYLSDSGQTGAGLGTESATSTATAATVSSPVDESSATARVADPAGVNIRAEAVTWAESIGTAPAGAVLVLRTATIDPVWDTEGREWWPVDVDGRLGWVAAEFLTTGVDETTTTATNTSADAPFAPGSYVTVETGALDGLNIRAAPAPGAAVVGYVRPGDIAQVMDGPVGFESSAAGWYMVTSGGVTGYVSGDFLAVAGQPDAPTATAVPTAAATTAAATTALVTAPVTATGAATVGDGSGDAVNLRETVGLDSNILASVPDGTAAEIQSGLVTDNAGGTWYYVSTAGGSGWVAASLVRQDGTPLATAPAATQPAATVPPTEASAQPTAVLTPVIVATARPTEAAEPTREPTEIPNVAPEAGVATGTFLVPTSGTVSQNYGCTSLPFYPIDPNSGCPFHNGLDIAAPQGTDIIASDGGTVTYAGWCDCGLGYYVEITHGNGYVTRYGHMASQPYVSTGTEVAQGDVIGPIGSTGFSTGPHIHFMVLRDGNTVDPRPLLPPLN